MGETDAPQKTEEKKYEVDENLANGPLAQRGCNDILCCILFLANIVVFVGIGAYGFSNGHPDRLLVAYDSDGRACGKDTAVASYPYIFMPAPSSLTRSVCLQSCPTDAISSQSTSASENTAAATSWSKMMYAATPSAFNTNPNVYNVANYVLSSNAALAKIAVYQTKPLFGRVCMPTGPDVAYLLSTVGSAFGTESQNIEKYIADVKVAWATILGSMGFAFIVALVYMVIIRYFAGLITWLSIIVFFASIIILAILLLKKGNEKIDEGTASGDSDTTNTGTVLKYISYAVFALAGLCFIIFLCIFRRIQQAIAIIKSAALFVAEVKSIFFVPPIISLLNMIFIAWWIISFVYVYSVGDIQGSSNGPFASVKWSKNVRYMLAYNVFGGLWINAFFGALIQFVIATACALWYFNKPNEPHRPVYTGLVRGMTNHFGSLAFGALILAIVQFVRIMLEYLKKQMQSTGQEQNKFVKYMLSCLSCYLACFERFIKFLNKNAYIQIAITGKNFCLAAKDAFFLILTNPVKFGLLATLGGVFIFIGKVFIAGVTGLIGYIILTNVEYYKTNLFSPLFPTFFCALIGYFIGSFFMSIYGMGVDTILQCTCLDEELMKKTGKNPDRCPGPLKEFFKDHGN